MKKITFYTLIILFLLPACKKKISTLKPENLINNVTLAEIISESYLIESMLYHLPYDSNRTTMTQSFYCELFQKYNVTKDQYVNSVKYYFTDKNMANELLTKAAQILDEKKEEFNRLNDSILRSNNDEYVNRYDERAFQ